MNHEEQTDERLAKLLQAVASPNAPNLALATRRRIRQRIRRQIVARSLTMAAVVVLLAAMFSFVSSKWGDQRPQVVAVPLDDSELASLFAPPPVDPLALIDRRQQVALQTLKQWERNR